MTAMVEAYTARVRGVVLARLNGPKVRKGTRHWADQVKPEDSMGAGGIKTARPVSYEVKALDADAAVPDSLIAEVVEAGRPVALRVARDAAADAAERLGVDVPDTSPDGDGMFAVDEELLADLVDEALEDLLGGASRYAEGLRQAILTGESDGLDLAGLLDRVEQAHIRGGNWLRLSARTVGTALAGKASLEQARAVGVTHTQWVSRRDDRVRPTHVHADGQVRPVGEPFTVGRHQLEYPGDPTGLPGTAEEVHGCRCGLIFADPGDDFWEALGEIAQSVSAGRDGAGVAPALAAARAATAVLDAEPDAPSLPGLASAIELPADVTGWRQLDAELTAPDGGPVAPGQQLHLPAGTSLGMAAPAALGATSLAVLVPAGTAIGVSGGALVLADAATVTVLAAGAGGVQGRLVPAE